MSVTSSTTLRRHLQSAATSLQHARDCFTSHNLPFAIRYGLDACVGVESVEPQEHILNGRERKDYVSLRYQVHMTYMQILIGRAEQILTTHHATPGDLEEAGRRLTSARYYATKERIPLRRQINGLLRRVAEAQKTLKTPLEIIP